MVNDLSDDDLDLYDDQEAFKASSSRFQTVSNLLVGS